ncbi:hypothetical protein OB13_05185 [Pontibacter sp. HJ8]|jgi:hypothetical protein
MEQSLTNAFGSVYLTIELDTLNRWVYVNWIGYPTEENMKTGVSAYTEVLTNIDYSSILLDTRLMIGTWEHSLNWMLYDWAPEAASAGLEYYAMVVQPETFAEATADDFLSKVTAFEAQVFEDMEEAKDWLRTKARFANPAFKQ